MNESLQGSFEGIGVQFNVVEDTLMVIQPVTGGPSEKVGIVAGDRIVSVNDTAIAGVKMSREEMMRRLRGPKDTKVVLGIVRQGIADRLSFTVVRDKIPVNTVEASYIIRPGVGYIRIGSFGATTHKEFLDCMTQLKSQGMTSLLLDLQANGGGYLQAAVDVANELLQQGDLIVYTKGRNAADQRYTAKGNGTFLDGKVVVLVDEYSASAAEIVTGAIQDNDRGLIIGRRSFGKGLIQQQISLPDSSAVRLTVGRYYTPSGRCIQKDFKRGNDDEYSLELYDRYTSGEVYNKDSIKVKTDQVFITSTGRTVYGGGGIIPDIFVPNDTSGITSYYINVVNANMMQRFAMQYCDINREAIAEMADYNELMSCMPSNDALLSDFVRFASQHGIPARWYYINISRNLIINQLRALIARDAFGNQAFYPVFNTADKTVAEAIKVLKSGKAEFPIVDEQESEKKSKK